MPNSKAKDNGFKVVFNEPELFIEFLRDFVKIDLFNDLRPEDIEDISERYLPLFQESKDSDTVKRINIKGDVPLFVIAILEHESKVNYRASFKMLQYIALVLNDYEKECDREKPKASFLKEFKYPPVLPIVFYDGPGNWTAERNFFDKTEFNEVFHKYIPKFEYELVSLNDYSEADILRFGDALSFVMLMDKIRTPDGINILGKLPGDYIERLKLNIPEHMAKLIVDVVTVFLKRISAPSEDIYELTEIIYQRRYQEMFTFLESYDVQETRRLSREEERKTTLSNMKKSNLTPEQMSTYSGIALDEVKRLLKELEK